MLRRFVIAGLAAALAAPAFAVTPASAAVLFTCPQIEADPESHFRLTPGLSHTQTAQTTDYGFVWLYGCSNGKQGYIYVGSAWGLGLSSPATYGPRPLGCALAWGGAGPDYPDQTPILLGGDYSFWVDWGGGGIGSYGIAKVKQGAAADQWRLVFNINVGDYAPPDGKKTKIKVTVNIRPGYPFDATCADDSNPFTWVYLTSVGPVIVTQK